MNRQFEQKGLENNSGTDVLEEEKGEVVQEEESFWGEEPHPESEEYKSTVKKLYAAVTNLSNNRKVTTNENQFSWKEYRFVALDTDPRGWKAVNAMGNFYFYEDGVFQQEDAAERMLVDLNMGDMDDEEWEKANNNIPLFSWKKERVEKLIEEITS